MNLEIANRLVALRKENKLSQEALAEKLGISRQAVSKWERAEASPDTDNLIALAKLYHISLDELLRIHEDEENVGAPDGGAQADIARRTNHVDQNRDAATDADKPEEGQEEGGRSGEQANGADPWNGRDDEEKVHVGFDGIHVQDKDGEVHVSWSGIHVQDKRKDNEVHIDRNGIRVVGEDAEKHIFTRGRDAEFPLGLIALVAYIVLGAVFNLWHPGWLVFFLVPIISSFLHALRERNAYLFAYPVLVVLVYQYIGWVHFIWHPTWVVFLTIPPYYSMIRYIRQKCRKDIQDKEDHEAAFGTMEDIDQ